MRGYLAQSSFHATNRANVCDWHVNNLTPINNFRLVKKQLELQMRGGFQSNTTKQKGARENYKQTLLMLLKQRRRELESTKIGFLTTFVRRITLELQNSSCTVFDVRAHIA